MELEIDLPVKVKWEGDGDGEAHILSVHVGDAKVNPPEEMQRELLGAIYALSPDDIAVDGEAVIDLYDVKVEVDYDYKAGAPDSYSSAHGNYLPGDDAQIDIKSVDLNGVDILSGISPKTLAKIDQKVFDYANSNENVSKRYVSAIEKVEKRLDKRMKRGKLKAKLVGKDSKIPGFSYWFQK